MTCPNCAKETSKTITRLVDGKITTRCHICGDFSEIGGINYSSPKMKQRLQWQRDKMAGDIVQPFEMRKGEVHKGYQPNKDFVKRYKDDPGKLSKFSKSELKDSGVVVESVATQAAKMPWGDNTPIKRTKIRSKKK